MQQWEYKVVALRDRHYTVALNEFGLDGWELVSVVSEPVETTSPGRGRAIPLPRVFGRLEEAAGQLNKLGEEDVPTATARLLWIFRRPLSDD